MSGPIRPAPLPEELAGGYMGRIMRINGFQTRDQSIRALSSSLNFSAIQYNEKNYLALLSAAVGQPPAQFEILHSTLPFRSLLRTVDHLMPNQVFSWPTPLAPGRSCPECIGEDVPFHGVSYWRRGHQLPGQLWCPKHLCPLRLHRRWSGFLSSPNKPGTAIPVRKKQRQTVLSAQNNPQVQRFLDLMLALGGIGYAISVEVMASEMRHRAKDLGFSTSAGTDNRPLLSDAILDTFPTDWLISVLRPNLPYENLDQTLCWVDSDVYRGKVSRRCTVWHYMLALAALSNDADEAINALAARATSYPASKNDVAIQFRDRFRKSTLLN